MKTASADTKSKTGDGYKTSTLSADELRKMHAYWRASTTSRSARSTSSTTRLLREPLKRSSTSSRGSSATGGRLRGRISSMRPPESDHQAIRPRRDLHRRPRPRRAGPGGEHAYLEGTYSEFYHGDHRATTDGPSSTALQAVQRSPAGFPSHVAPETPGSIHEGGELGYSLSHAFGAAFDNPDLLVACVIGDGEAETGAPWRPAGTATSS